MFEVNEDYDAHIYKRVLELYQKPFLQLIQEAASIHRLNWPDADIQTSTLLSIKTGSCPEDCSYCPQSARYDTDIQRHELMDIEEIVNSAQIAKSNGATRFCMGAAWRKPPRGEQFDRVLTAVKEVKNLGLETCVTLGLLSSEQAAQLKDAGLDYYNHNVDTSKDFYNKVITTRKFSDRVNTLKALRENDIKMCCGGILGMGESIEDRISLLAFLASLNPQPESVPLNFLVKVEGTPLAKNPDLDVLDFIRTIAVARIVMPKSRIRLSAGRMQLSREAHILAFSAGANSIHSGDTLLTTALPGASFDEKLLRDMQQPIQIQPNT